MNQEKPQIGDLVEVAYEVGEQRIPAAEVCAINGESSDARGYLYKLTLPPYKLGAPAEKFAPKTPTPDKIRADTGSRINWTAQYGEMTHM